MPTLAAPVFDSPEFLKAHIRSILNFYEPRVMAPEGGFYQCFHDDGNCYEPATRQLVGSARYVFNYATAYRVHGTAHYRQWALHGLDFLNNTHRQPNGHYAWLIEKNQITDTRVMAYGHAFVVLAAASCIRSGITEAEQTLETTWRFLENNFWDSQYCAYADERDSSLAKLESYRGQNANMHMCEAALAAWRATSHSHYLERAEQLAQRFTIDLAQQASDRFDRSADRVSEREQRDGNAQTNRSSRLTTGLVWEHYSHDWQIDEHFNQDNPNDRYKPWGFQPGHQVEWAKLLLTLHEYRPDTKWLDRARELFDQGMRAGWDTEFGGLVYSVAPDGNVCAVQKYFWVHAEALAAAWRLYKLTREPGYKREYDRIWQWAWDHLVDHEHGAWYRVRNRDGSPIDSLKSPPGKTDYHTLGACWDVLENL